MRQDGPDWGAASALPTLHNIENPNQRRVLWMIHKYPGLNSQELAQVLGLARTAVVYHVRRLTRLGLIIEEKQGQHKLHFPASLPSAKRRALCQLRVPSVRKVALALFAAPRDTIRAVAERVEMNPRTVRRALQGLRHDNLAFCEKNGRGQIVHLHPEVRLVLARWSADADAPTMGAYPEDDVGEDGLLDGLP